MLLLGLMINACGFQLRGYDDNRLSQTSLMINSADKLTDDINYRHFERLLKRDLKNTGAEIDEPLTDNIQDKKALQISLFKLSFSSQGISRDGTGRAYEQEITARLDYQLNVASLKPIENEKPISSLTATSNYFQDYRNPAAGEVQKKQTQTLLMQQLSLNLIRQIEFELTPQ